VVPLKRLKLVDFSGPFVPGRQGDPHADDYLRRRPPPPKLLPAARSLPRWREEKSRCTSRGTPALGRWVADAFGL
jgi:hypothetical protein